jgi:RimJ/RimL family protein N-acetyltransferase
MAQRTPPGYPTELVSDLVLREGRRVHIRPILPEDAPALAEAITNADDETLRSRFLGSSPVMDETMLRHLVEVDYQHRLALVALDSTGRGVGIARYEGSLGDDVAEVAVAVSRAWRRIGLGSGLFMLLAQAALARGITRFRASCLVDNEDVIGLLRASNLPYRSSASKGVVETELELRIAGIAPQPSA